MWEIRKIIWKPYLIINSPSNPTGGVWSNDAIAKILEISKKNLRDEYLEKQFKELTKERPDPDLQNGLGSIVYKLNKD